MQSAGFSVFGSAVTATLPSPLRFPLFSKIANSTYLLSPSFRLRNCGPAFTSLRSTGKHYFPSFPLPIQTIFIFLSYRVWFGQPVTRPNLHKWLPTMLKTSV